MKRWAEKRMSLSQPVRPPQPTTITIETSHARLSVTSIGPQDTAAYPDVLLYPAIILIHGNRSLDHDFIYTSLIVGREEALSSPRDNSFDSTIFRLILASPLSRTHRLIAPDLPGHGKSTDAVDPNRTYNHPGYADCMVELLDRLGIKEVIILGWCLGGHIGIEMLPRFSGVKGLMIVGTPPVGHRRGEFDRAFKWLNGWEKSMAGRDDLTESECILFAETAADKLPDRKNYPSEFWDCVKRSDQKARKLMWGHFAAGKCSDQRKIVGDTKVLTGVVNGVGDHYVNLKYLESVEFGNLWEGITFVLAETLHAPFYGNPRAFEEGFKMFVNDCSKITGSAWERMINKMEAKAGGKDTKIGAEEKRLRDKLEDEAKNGSMVGTICRATAGEAFRKLAKGYSKPLESGLDMMPSLGTQTKAGEKDSKYGERETRFKDGLNRRAKNRSMDGTKYRGTARDEGTKGGEGKATAGEEETNAGQEDPKVREKEPDARKEDPKAKEEGEKDGGVDPKPREENQKAGEEESNAKQEDLKVREEALKAAPAFTWAKMAAAGHHKASTPVSEIAVATKGGLTPRHANAGKT